MNLFSSKGIKTTAIAIAVGIGAFSFSVNASAENYYKEFGEKAGIKAFVDSAVANVAADNRINYYFAHANIPHLKMALTNQFCQLLGGPCEYKGPSMGAVHKGMGVTEAAFNALTEDFMKAMDQHHIPIGAQNHLIKLLAPMANPIVTK